MSSSRPICPPWRPSARHLRAKPPSRRTRMPGALWPTLAGSAPASAAGPVIMESPDPSSYWPVTTNSKQWAMAGPWNDLCESGRARPGHLSPHVLAAMARKPGHDGVRTFPTIGQASDCAVVSEMCEPGRDEPGHDDGGKILLGPPPLS